MRTTRLLVGGIIILVSAASQAALFSDDFDVDSSANWNINTSSADTSVIFAFDYSTVGIPPAPNSGGTTLGLRMAANMDATPSTEAITLSPVGRQFTGSYVLKFNMWINANGPFPGGGAGSTEYLTAGIGYDDITVNKSGAAGSGGWFAVDGEGGSSRDYRAHKNAAEQFAESSQFFAGLSSAGGGAHNSSDPYYASFGGFDVAAAVPAQTALYPGQTGALAVGSVGFAWHEVTVTVNGETALWEIDGLPIVELDPQIGSPFPLSGNISIGYMDVFTSISDNPDVSFGLIDNLVVLPDPSAAWLANSPTPPDNANLVSTGQSLQWMDPSDITPVAYDVYLRTADPNFGPADKVVDYRLVNTYEPPAGLEPETLYFWRVDSYDPNDGGTPVWRQGNVWTFRTAPLEPLIEKDPARVVTVPLGASAQLSVVAVNADSYTWYKLTDGGPQTVPGADTETLTINSATVDDEGYYHCSVTNETGVIVSSDAGRILTRRKMAHWKFDNNLNDEVDSANDGVSPGVITYVAGIDGQAVKIAAPDQFVQIDNAIGLLNEVSVSMWIYPPTSVITSDAALIVPQEGGPDYGGIGSVSLTTAANQFHAKVQSGNMDASAGTIIPDTWNHLLLVYAPAVRQADLYINGRHASTVTGIDPGVLPNLGDLGIGARSPSEIGDLFEQGLIDDVRIYNYALSSLNAASLYTEFVTDQSVCLDDVLPQYDLNGDCIFDLKDFAVIAATWLECNLVPDCIQPDIP